MDLHKLSTDEVRGWDPAKRKEAADDIRRDLGKMRMDIYTAKSQNSGKIRGLKKSLARLMTIRSEEAKKAPKVAKPVAAKPAAKAKAKPAKAAAPVAKAKEKTAAKPKVKSKGDKK